MSEKSVKVLFIAGAGRSGSTILDDILGQLPGFAAVGEIRYLWQRGMIEDRLCACKSPFSRCELWRGVLTEAFGDTRRLDPHRLVRLQNKGMRVRHLPRMLIDSRKEHLLSKMGELPQELTRVYRAIQQRTGSKVIVDSSKLPPYGYLLDAMESIDLFVVHLIRDSRATAFSWMRKKRQPDRGDNSYMEQMKPAKAASLWATWNVAAELFWRRTPDRYLPMRYEDFVANPSRAVEQILELVKEHPAQLPFLSERAVKLDITHDVGGNPSRFVRGRVELRPDDEWKLKLSGRDRAIVTAITWPLLVRYGYMGSKRHF